MTKPYSVSVLYSENKGSHIANKLRVIHVNAVSEEEAVGMALNDIPNQDSSVKNMPILLYTALEFKMTVESDEKKDKKKKGG